MTSINQEQQENDKIINEKLISLIQQAMLEDETTIENNQSNNKNNNNNNNDEKVSNTILEQCQTAVTAICEGNERNTKRKSKKKKLHIKTSKSIQYNHSNLQNTTMSVCDCCLLS